MNNTTDYYNYPYPPSHDNIIPNPNDFVPMPLPYHIETIFTVLYAIIMAFALSGNTLVIVVILGNKSLRNVTNMFFISLAISDILIAGFNIPVNLLYTFNTVWTFGEALCKTISFATSVNVVASIMTLTVVALERYYAICHPLKIRYLKSNTRVLVLMFVVWILALAVSSPFLFVQKIAERLQHLNGPPYLKVVEVCVEHYEKMEMEEVHTLVQFVIFFCVPIGVMFFAYGNIAHQLWIRKPIGDSHDLEKSMQQKKRIIKMLIVIVLVFLICWLPFFAVHIYRMYNNVDYEDFRMVSLVVQIIGFTNSAVNPIMYGFMNQKFKQTIRVMYVRCRSKLYRGKNASVNSQSNSAPNSLTAESVV
ncbi:QRFP-like peptide receptor [Saccostrea echinata]|uniref:QRFP-like peptide receptor n=1 Tax=Saccostrea echinata TaxID=191078 RepID=UPI002A80ED4B|nr:QRFP-like peptide receptor [Saccostrea echinata]XP_061175448.1 QRFP-like peptide receptor [Saccostrea echinata]XP_061175449.1 QRFP-like peptide receptor [Saccostrea echinata]